MWRPAASTPRSPDRRTSAATTSTGSSASRSSSRSPRSACTPRPTSTSAAGPGTGWTARNNVAAFRRWMFRPRVLVDVSALDTSTTVLGTPVAAADPVRADVGPQAGPSGRRARDGPRGARRLDTVQVLSTGSSVPHRGRRDGRPQALVPALLVHGSRADAVARGAGGGGRLRGDRAHGRRRGTRSGARRRRG